VIRKPGDNRPRVVVVSPLRVYRDCLALALAQHGFMDVVGVAAGISDLSSLIDGATVDIVLFDLAVDGALAALRWLGCYLGLKVVVLGLCDEEAQIVALARAGIAGYVTQEDSLQELVHRIRDATAGEFSCTPRVAATLLRSLADSTMLEGREMVTARLTPRESEIVKLVEQGLSNKEIAQHLTIQVSTVKNHVHNILEKLGVSRRADAARLARSIKAYPAIVGGTVSIQSNLDS
jgi:DNA-binding NarL/FixJ family response regulator